jgi:GntR family transcriptional regulator
LPSRGFTARRGLDIHVPLDTPLLSSVYIHHTVLLTIDTNDRRPVYRQIADGIKALIAGGQLREGHSLPAVRQVAADLGVNLNTIAAAYRELQSEGLIVVRRGLGASIASRSSAQQSAKHSEDDLRRPLRTALTELVLAGMLQGEILSMVSDELRSLLKGAKS